MRELDQHFEQRVNLAYKRCHVSEVRSTELNRGQIGIHLFHSSQVRPWPPTARSPTKRALNTFTKPGLEKTRKQSEDLSRPGQTPQPGSGNRFRGPQRPCSHPWDGTPQREGKPAKLGHNHEQVLPEEIPGSAKRVEPTESNRTYSNLYWEMSEVVPMTIWCFRCYRG